MKFVPFSQEVVLDAVPDVGSAMRSFMGDLERELRDELLYGPKLGPPAPRYRTNESVFGSDGLTITLEAYTSEVPGEESWCDFSINEESTGSREETIDALRRALAAMEQRP